MNNLGSNRGGRLRKKDPPDNDLFKYHALVEQYADTSLSSKHQFKQGLFGKNRSDGQACRAQPTKLHAVVKSTTPPVDGSSPGKTEATSASSDSCVSSTGPYSTDSECSVFHDSSQSSNSSTTSCSVDISYIRMDESAIDDENSPQVMTPAELIKMLEAINTKDEDTSPGFLFKKEAPPPLLMEELTDILCHVNTCETAKVEIQWERIYNVVHRKEDDQDEPVPIEQVEFPDDDISTASSLSVGSFRLRANLLDSLSLDLDR